MLYPTGPNKHQSENGFICFSCSLGAMMLYTHVISNINIFFVILFYLLRSFYMDILRAPKLRSHTSPRLSCVDVIWYGCWPPERISVSFDYNFNMGFKWHWKLKGEIYTTKLHTDDVLYMLPSHHVKKIKKISKTALLLFFDNQIWANGTFMHIPCTFHFLQCSLCMTSASGLEANFSLWEVKWHTHTATQTPNT